MKSITFLLPLSLRIAQTQLRFSKRGNENTKIVISSSLCVDICISVCDAGFQIQTFLNFYPPPRWQRYEAAADRLRRCCELAAIVHHFKGRQIQEQGNVNWLQYGLCFCLMKSGYVGVKRRRKKPSPMSSREGTGRSAATSAWHSHRVELNGSLNYHLNRISFRGQARHHRKR